MKRVLSTGIRKQQGGYTLIEILVALAIAGLLATGILTSITQLFTVNASSNARMTAIKQIELAVDRIRMDMQMAQEIYDSDPDNPDVFLVLKWKEWDNTLNEVKYSINTASHQLNRQPSQGALNAVARNIESVQTSELISGNWRVIITANVEGFKSAVESRTFEVQPRSRP
jgi:prepilin-type N-terminal cleavage/methylation domain-containing protein